jgi:hypothetical protein
MTRSVVVKWVAMPMGTRRCCRDHWSMSTVGPAALLLLTKTRSQAQAPRRGKRVPASRRRPDVTRTRRAQPSSGTSRGATKRAQPDLMDEALRRWISEGGALQRSPE